MSVCLLWIRGSLDGVRLISILETICTFTTSFVSLAQPRCSFYYPTPEGVGNEVGASDPIFMKKYGEELAKDSGKWIDSSVWHGKAHTWEKIPWLIQQVSVFCNADWYMK